MGIYEDGLDELPINASQLNKYRRIMKRFWSHFGLVFLKQTKSEQKKKPEMLSNQHFGFFWKVCRDNKTESKGENKRIYNSRKPHFVHILCTKISLPPFMVGGYLCVT
ncbi:hypothetical protein DB330_02300 [Lacticaseibacillus casei]|nr:hypothetical protein [Lacticaseibacillus casei]PTU98602.1 hypothetical protein DB330_02300 [Lacticaseibacillus casei]PTU99745.1 hypothetical protein DB326_01370 [Lacticaseibacillus casei]